MNVINLTPHDIHFIVGDDTITIPASGTVARANTIRKRLDTVTVNGTNIPVNKTVFGDIDGLPGPSPDTIFIVSAIVAKAVPHRDDVFVVDDTVRDDSGRIVGARALARV